MGFRTYQGNSRSENGWRIVDTDEIVKVVVPGTTQQIELRRGDAATILVAWMKWYHLNVEPIDRFKPRDDWGFSWDNDVANSNHLSGTAVDINATQYPWTQYTMSKDKQEKVRRGLELFEGVIFWGRDWSRVDEMHYQLNYTEGDARVAALAKKLSDGYLGLYGEDNSGSGGTSVWGEQIKNFLGNMVSFSTIMFHLDRKLDAVYKQLVEGWEQLGKNKKGQNLTLVDNAANQNAKLDKLLEQNARLIEQNAAAFKLLENSKKV